MKMSFMGSNTCEVEPAVANRALAEQLEDYIERRAKGRIRELRVFCSEDAIIIQGLSRTYHGKQLAQQAVLDLTDGYPLLTNDIVVMSLDSTSFSNRAERGQA